MDRHPRAGRHGSPSPLALSASGASALLAAAVSALLPGGVAAVSVALPAPATAQAADAGAGVSSRRPGAPASRAPSSTRVEEGPARTQDAAPTARTPEAAVRGLFDAMRDADSAAARAYLHPDVRLSRPVTEDGRTVLRTSDADGWLNAIGGAEPGRLDEKIWDLEVRRDGRLATAWMQYAFYLDGELHHCGVNAFQLVRTDAGWKVFGVADTSRREGCEGPPETGG